MKELSDLRNALQELNDAIKEDPIFRKIEKLSEWLNNALTKKTIIQGQCKDCKWWEEEEKDWGQCTLHSEDTDMPAGKASAQVADGGSSGYGVLMTEPDFGCVQFESKEIGKD